MSIFEQASRAKLRFETSKGNLSVEDLWDLPLTSARSTNLDDIARELFTQLKGDTNVSFVNPTHKANAKVQLAFDVVKHIIDTRLVENAAESVKKANAEKKQRILEIIERKEIDALGNTPIEELRALANSL